jgi:hypothetical protein
LVFGFLIFIPINLLLFDRTTSSFYDPIFGYSLVIFGVIFIIFTAILLFNIIVRQHLNAKFCYFNTAVLIFFTIFSLVLNNTFAFPMMSYFSVGGLFLLIPVLINLWVIRGHGPDLIIEGKEFNRLAKLAIKSFPYELHSIYKDPIFLGEGGFGRVFKAIRSDGTDVAIKIPKTFDKRSEKTFITEVSNWNKLDHPNIVKLYDYKILPIPFIEVEYCERMLEHGQKPLDEAIEVIRQVATGLSYAHQKNIIHGDIKTGNILINRGLYKISDWGLSKLKITESVSLSGATPQYAAPEQISREFGRADERTDIYQLGDVFYELVTGEVPFKGEISEIYGSILTKKPTPPSQINPQSAIIEPIIMKCLKKEKDERFSSMEELIKALEEFSKHDTVKDDTVIFKDEKEKE